MMGTALSLSRKRPSGDAASFRLAPPWLIFALAWSTVGAAAGECLLVPRS